MLHESNQIKVDQGNAMESDQSDSACAGKALTVTCAPMKCNTDLIFTYSKVTVKKNKGLTSF